MRVFHWSLRDSKSSHVSKTFLGIQADLNNAVAWMVSILPRISSCANPVFKPLKTVPSAPFTIGITVTHMFPRFFVDNYQ